MATGGRGSAGGGTTGRVGRAVLGGRSESKLAPCRRGRLVDVDPENGTTTKNSGTSFCSSSIDNVVCLIASAAGEGHPLLGELGWV